MFVIICFIALILLNYSLFYVYYRRKRQVLLTKALGKEMHLLSQHIFTAILRYGELSQQFSLEKTIHHHTKLMTKLLIKAEHYQLADQKYWHMVFDIILAMGQLRYRLHADQAINLCYREIESIAIHLAPCWQWGAERHEESLLKLKQALSELEDVYQHVLEVSSQDPLIFLFFITQLNALIAAMSERFAEMERLKIKVEVLSAHMGNGHVKD